MIISVKRVIDYKKIDMSNDEWIYYQKLIKTFSTNDSSGSQYFHDLFDADDDGYIYMIHPPFGREIPWAVIMFLQNLMINQHERKRDRIFENKLQEFEDKIKEKINV